MSFTKALIARLTGRASRKGGAKSAGPSFDPFDLRLQRIGLREARVPVRPVLFRTRSALLAV